MTVEIYQLGTFENTHERVAADKLIANLQEKFGRRSQLYIVLVDYSVGGKSIDLTILKKDAIVIVELKSESKQFTATEGNWVTIDGRNVGGGYPPLNQIKDYRFAWSEKLRSKGGSFRCFEELSTEELKKISLRIHGMVAIDPKLPEGTKNEIGKLPWFRLGGLDEVAGIVDFWKAKGFNLSDDELRSIPTSWLGMSGPYSCLTMSLQENTGSQPDLMLAANDPTSVVGSIRPLRSVPTLKKTAHENVKSTEKADVKLVTAASAFRPEHVENGYSKRSGNSKWNYFGGGVAIVILATVVYLFLPGLVPWATQNAPVGSSAQKPLSPSSNSASAVQLSGDGTTSTTATTPDPFGFEKNSNVADKKDSLGKTTAITTGDEIVDRKVSVLSKSELQDVYLRKSLRSGVSGSTYPAWTIVAWNSAGNHGVLTDEMIDLLTRSGIPNPIDVFTDRFLNDGNPESILQGYEDVVYKIGLDEFIDYLVLAKVTDTPLPDGGRQNIHSVRVNIELLVLELNPDNKASMIRSSEVASGYSQENATQRAINLALAKIEDEVSAKVSY